jgi:hypothetical protein
MTQPERPETPLQALAPLAATIGEIQLRLAQPTPTALKRRGWTPRSSGRASRTTRVTFSQNPGRPTPPSAHGQHGGRQRQALS